jgi:predicted naringenin-chalcone synthase
LAYVNWPGVGTAPYEVTTEDIVSNILGAHPGYSRRKGLPRFAANTGVETRRFVRPLSEVATSAPYEVHNEAAVAGVIGLSAEAARNALDNAGIKPHEIGTYIHFHVTGQTVPGAADYVADELGLRPDVVVIPMTELACAGGANALALAAKHAQPGAPVLIAGAEVLSSAYQLHNDLEVQHMAYKVLFGDGGAAAVVTHERRPGAPCMEILDSWQYRLPGSLHFYKGRFDHLGIHFDSTKEALEAVGLVVPRLPWIGTEWNPTFGIVHPGSRQILETVAEHGGIPKDGLRYSFEALRTHGNCGGPMVLKVLQRAFEDPPPAGTPGLLMAFGPGFRLEASRVRWLS